MGFTADRLEVSVEAIHPGVRLNSEDGLYSTS